MPDRRRGGVLRRARTAGIRPAPPARHDQTFLYAFDLLELDGTDLRREPIEVRKADARQHLAQEPAGDAAERAPWHPGGMSCSRTPARWASRALCRSGWARAIAPAARRDWLKFKYPDAPAVKRETEEDWRR